MENRLDTKLKKALKDVSESEKKYRYRVISVSAIILAVLCIFIYFTYLKINQYSKEVKRLESTSTKLKIKINSLNSDVDSLKSVLYNLNAFSEFSTKWDSSDIATDDKVKFEEAMKAHNEILKIAQKIKLNPDLSIRYYIKRADFYKRFYNISEPIKKNRVQNTLRRAGYRAIDAKSSDYRYGLATNSIYYSKDIANTDLQVIALALIRAGIDLKLIAKYPKSMSKRKANSVEISSQKNVNGRANLTISDIISAKYD